MQAVLQEMFDCFSKGNPVYLPSKFWESYNEKNLGQLESHGYDNFKQTLALNYFTWIVDHKHEQFQYLLKKIGPLSYLFMLEGFFTNDSHSVLTRKQQATLGIFTKVLWHFARELDREKVLPLLEEPLEGNPLRIFSKGKLISQDIANSVIEFYSIREQFKVPFTQSITVCELGAGYGRNAYVFLKVFPRCKYIVIDIPPALYVAQRYLSSVFNQKKIFQFRDFKSFSEIEDEFSQADIIFLLPHQADLLPGKIVDLFINISSLHEMLPEQIKAYFGLIDHITKHYFYSKQWWNSINPFDKINIKHTDYPVPSNWKELYLRDAKVQTSFFESMYSINGNAEGD
ncbi:MAG: putative sugar O-methyltransferase [Chloroflexi bacterium]|nr:putative sugar O-methyltransferase [Chloroflexota bacterium]